MLLVKLINIYYIDYFLPGVVTVGVLHRLLLMLITKYIESNQDSKTSFQIQMKNYMFI